MRFVIKTPIKQNYLTLYQKFDRNLFEALAPSFPKMELLRFDGSASGDIIHLKFIPFNIEWISKITADNISEKEAYFIDEGILLPPGLNFWKHVHKIERVSDTQSIIIDDITFKGTNGFFSFILYPILWLSFYPRKKAYVKYFK